MKPFVKIIIGVAAGAAIIGGGIFLYRKYATKTGGQVKLATGSEGLWDQFWANMLKTGAFSGMEPKKIQLMKDKFLQLPANEAERLVMLAHKQESEMTPAVVTEMTNLLNKIKP